ncbi:MAG: hypothetical protein OEW66_09645, partial [Actinomycetota bacterium]|nr:hypothetical protein [Actinomycetota bacterium]
MSEIWLVLAVASAFFAIVLIGLAVESGSSEKKRAIRLLESQVSGSTESVNLRDQELQKNFGQRVLVPVVGTAGRVARRVTPLDTRDRVAKKLLLAGGPAGWDAERVLAFKVIGAVCGVFGGFVLSTVLQPAPFISIVAIALLAFVGFVLPDS